MNYTGVYAINKYIFLWHEDVILTIYVHYCIHVHDNDRDVNNIIIIIFSVVFFHHHYLYYFDDGCLSMHTTGGKRWI